MVQGFVGIEIAIGIEIDSLISAGHFSSIPIAIPISISIWSFLSDKSGRSAAGGLRLPETTNDEC